MPPAPGLAQLRDRRAIEDLLGLLRLLHVGRRHPRDEPREGLALEPLAGLRALDELAEPAQREPLELFREKSELPVRNRLQLLFYELGEGAFEGSTASPSEPSGSSGSPRAPA